MRALPLLMLIAAGCTPFRHQRISEAAADVVGCTPGAFSVTERKPDGSGWRDFAVNGCGRQLSCYTRYMEEIQCKETEASRDRHFGAMERVRREIQREREAVAAEGATQEAPPSEPPPATP